MRTATAVDVSDIKSSCCDGFASPSSKSTSSTSCVLDKNLNDSDESGVGGNDESGLTVMACIEHDNDNDKCEHEPSSTVPNYENVVMLTQSDINVALVPKHDDEIYEPIMAHHSSDDGAEISKPKTTISNMMTDDDDKLDIQKQIEDEILKNFLCNDDDALTSSKYTHDDDGVVSRDNKCEMQPEMSLHDVTTKDNCAVAAASVESENVGCDVLPEFKLASCSSFLPSSSPRYSSSSSHASTSLTTPYVSTGDSSQNKSRKTVRKNFSLWIGVTSCVWGLLLLLVKNYVN